MTIITSKYKLLLFFIMPLSPHHNSRGFMWWPYLSVRWSVAQNAGPTNPAGQQCSRKRPQRCWATRTTGVPECFLLPEKLHPTKFMLAAGDYPWHPQTHATLVLFDDWWTKTALLISTPHQLNDRYVVGSHQVYSVNLNWLQFNAKPAVHGTAIVLLFWIFSLTIFTRIGVVNWRKSIPPQLLLLLCAWEWEVTMWQTGKHWDG